MLEVNFKSSWNYNGRRGTETYFHTAIGSFITAMRDWAPAFRVMANEILEPEVQRQFETAGHGEWADLMPDTVIRKQQRGQWGGRMGILTATGRLAGSFHAGGQDHVENIGRQSMQWGSRVPYALFHQTGTGSGFQRKEKGGGPGLPMRKILSLSKSTQKEMRSIMVQRMATIARHEGFGIAPGLGLDPLAARFLGQSALGL